jgi:hypothetical protein
MLITCITKTEDLDYIEALMLSTGQKCQEDLLQRNARRMIGIKIDA